VTAEAAGDPSGAPLSLRAIADGPSGLGRAGTRRLGGSVKVSWSFA